MKKQLKTIKEMQNDKGVEVYQKEISPIIKTATTLSITNPSELQDATEVLSRLNQFNDRIDEEKSKVLVPLLEATKAERARWKPIEALYTDAIAMIRAKMTSYQTKLLQAQEAQKQAIASKVATGYTKLETAITKIGAIEAPDKKVSSTSGSISFKAVKKFEVVDFTKLAPEYI